MAAIISLSLNVFLLFVSQVQTLLQQMQDKFQTMSDQIIGRNILICWLHALTFVISIYFILIQQYIDF